MPKFPLGTAKIGLQSSSGAGKTWHGLGQPRSVASAHGTILKFIKKQFKNVYLALIGVTERGAGGVLGSLRVVLGGSLEGEQSRGLRVSD